MLDFTETDGLFDNFEVNREPFWPRISWLLAGSGAWHLVLLACILMIPSLRNAFNLTVMFEGGGFVDRPYNKTEIVDDSDVYEITTEKFRYPDGYFAMDQQGMPIQPFPMSAPFTPPVFSPSQMATPPPTPTPFPIVIPTPAIAMKSPSASPSPKTAAEKEADQKVAEKGQKELEAASKQTGIELPAEGEVNKAPFKDLAAYANDLKSQGKLDFDKPFELEIETELDKNGKLVKPHVSKHLGDDNLVDLGARLVGAMNDSGILAYLKKINEDKPGTKVVFMIKHDGNEVLATVTSEVTSTDSARQLAAGFRLLLLAGADSRKGKNEEIIIRSTNVSADGKNIIFKLKMAHNDVVDIVNKGMAPEPSPTATPSGAGQ